MNWEELLSHEVLATLIVGGLLLLVLFLTHYLFRFFRKRLVREAHERYKGIFIKGHQLVTPAQQVRLYGFGLTMLRLVVTLTLIYTSFAIIFRLFPATQDVSDKLLDLVLTPLHKVGLRLVQYLPNFITIVVVWFLFHYALKFLRFLSNEVERGKLSIKGFYPEWAQPTFSILRFLMYALFFVVVFQNLPGSDSDVFKGVSVFIGVLLSLGSSSTIANIMSGIVVTYMRPFKVGDHVKIGDARGDVVEKNLLITRLRTIKNEDITIPNSTVLSSFSTNYSAVAAEKGLILNTSVTIGYDTPWRQVHQLLIAATKATEGINASPEPFVFQTELNDYFVCYQINAYTSLANLKDVVYSDLHKNIQDKFFEAGVEIMSPHYLSIRDGNKPAMPDEYRK